MPFLPDNFPAEELSSIERRKLEYFYEQFVIRNADLYGYGHFALACYAALPAVLTSDLLHKLWLNFKNYKLNGEFISIHPIAPTDILLSPLVEEIGFELYEMPEKIRKALMLFLKRTTADYNPYKLFPLVEIAQFLWDYSQFDFTPENKDDNAFREAQEWTALSFLDPGKAFSQVAQAFQGAATSAGKSRYKDAIEKMSARFSLEIVKDANAIPPGFKAMNALTSVVKDVLQERDPVKLKELQDEAHETQDLLTDLPILLENVINIEVPEKVSRIMEKPDAKVAEGLRKVKALIVGVGKNTTTDDRYPSFDLNNASLIASAIKNLVPEGQLQVNILIGADAGKSNILRQLQILTENAGKEDDLLFYFSTNAISNQGHCHAACYTDTSSTRGDEWLTDEEVGNIVNESDYGSLTCILEIDFAATPFWSDIKNKKNINFFSCKHQQYPESLVAVYEEKQYSAFTCAVATTLMKNGMHITNRNLFIEVLKNYQEVLKGRMPDTDNIFTLKAPQLTATPEGYNRFFLEGNNKLLLLQNQLRLAGFYDEISSGKWDEKTVSSILMLNENTDTAPALSKQDYIQYIEKIKSDFFAVQHPVYLFIFSDPGKKLSLLNEEKSKILGMFSAAEKSFNFQILLLEDPEKNELINMLKHKSYRNQIQLVYYSGFDDRGNYVFRDGTFTIWDFASLLDYQENIQLLVSNTCKSQYFADYSTQLGVRMAVGSEDLIYDDFSSEFGVRFCETLLSKGNLDAFINDYSRERQSNI